MMTSYASTCLRLGLSLGLAAGLAADGFGAPVKPIDYVKLEPDAIVWANPCEGKKPRVLFVSVDGGAAEAGCVARRLEMDYRVIRIGTAWGYDNSAARREETLKTLEEDFDVCVLGTRTHFGSFPPDIRYHLMKKAINGMGVITLWYWHYPFPESIIKWQPPSGGSAGLVPFGMNLFEVLRADTNAASAMARLDDRGRWIPAGFKYEPWAKGSGAGAGDRFYVSTTTVGSTRLALMSLAESGYVVRSSFVSATSAMRDMRIQDEYYLSALCNTILWAAHREPSATVRVESPQGGLLPAEGVQVAVESKQAVAAELAWAVRNCMNQVEQSGQKPVTVSAEKQTVKLEIPALPADSYYVDVWLKAGKKTIDWASGYFHVQGPGRIADLTLAKSTHERGEAVAGTITVTNAAPDVTVSLKLIDSWNRELSQQSIPVKGEVVTFSVMPEASVGGIMFYLQADLITGGRSQSRVRYPVPIRRPRPDYYFNICLGEDGGSFHMARLRRQVLSKYRSDGNNYFDGAIAGAQELGWDGLEPDGFHRYTGTLRDEAILKHSQGVASMVKAGQPYGLRFVNMGDDSGPDCSLGSQGTNTDLFCDYLKGMYGSLEKVNAEWGTQLTDWNQIDQKFIDDQKGAGRFPAAADVFRFGEDRYLATARSSRQAAQAVDPQAAVGCYASGWGAGMGEYVEAANYFAPYWRMTECEALGAFYAKQPGYYGANGGYQGNGNLGPWYPLLCGLNYVSCWYSAADLRSDFSMHPETLLFYEGGRDIKKGLGMQVVRSRRVTDPVAILSSRFSGHASEFESRLGEIGNSRLNFNAICHDLGLQYVYISGKQLTDGMLGKEKIKVLILPYCQALTSAEAQTIREFAAGGGTVLADVRPAVWDEHCKKLEKGLLDDVFGISRKPVEDYVVFGDLKLTREAAGFPAGEIVDAATADRSVAGTTAVAHAELGGIPALLVNEVGKGRAVLLNFAICRYAMRQVDGESLKLSQVFGWIFRQAGVETDRVKAVINGRPAIGLRRVLFENGPMTILGVHKRGLDCERYPVDVTFELPQEREVYEMRSGRHVGSGKSIRDTLGPEQIKFYSLLPYRVKAVDVEVPKEGVKGKTLAGTVALTVSRGTASPHALWVQVKGPGGTDCAWFDQELMSRDGKAELRLPIAANEQPGEYTIEVKDVPSGIVGRKTFAVR